MPIREANIDDAAVIARIHVDSWRTTYVGIVPAEYLASLSYERREQIWRESLADRGRADFTLVAESAQGEVVGFATGGPERSGNPDYRGELYAIYLNVASQRRGIGGRLFDAVVERLLSLSYDSLVVWVLADNPARRFYEALGGKVVFEKRIEIGGASLVEVAYGWKELNNSDLH
jgi:ribosomal protein S18 acetylase RimI-like enzyme